MRTAAILVLASSLAAFGAIEGTVQNGSTGKLQAGDVVTLIRFSQILSGPVAPTFLGENDLF